MEVPHLYIPLEISAGKNQKAFYAYVNSELNKRQNNSESTFSKIASGGFQLELIANLGDNSNERKLKFHFKTTDNGLLAGVSVSPADNFDNPDNWRDIAYEFFTAALAATLSQKVSNFPMRRKLYYVGAELDGEYWFGNIRFSPAEKIPSAMPIARWERAVHLDFKVAAIDDLHAIDLANQIELGYSARLSLLLDVDLYPHSSHQVWVQLPEGGWQRKMQ